VKRKIILLVRPEKYLMEKEEKDEK